MRRTGSLCLCVVLYKVPTKEAYRRRVGSDLHEPDVRRIVFGIWVTVAATGVTRMLVA